MDLVIRFLEGMRLYALAMNGGRENDFSRLLNWGRLGARAANTAKRHLQEAVAKVEQLVAEKRAMNEEEFADLDANIRDKLSRAAGVQVPPQE